MLNTNLKSLRHFSSYSKFAYLSPIIFLKCISVNTENKPNDINNVSNEIKTNTDICCII